MKYSINKYLLFHLIVIWPMLSLGQQNTISVGFMWEAISRGGFYLGYGINNLITVEAHIGAIPHSSTMGISMKLKPWQDNRSHYFIIGPAWVMGFSHRIPDTPSGYMLTTTSALVLNCGYGYEFGAMKSKLRFPVEIGGGPVLSFKKRTTHFTSSAKGNKIEINNKNNFPFLFFMGGGIGYCSEKYINQS